MQIKLALKSLEKFHETNTAKRTKKGVSTHCTRNEIRCEVRYFSALIMNSSTFRPPTGDVLNAERYCGAQRPPGIQDPDAVIGPVGSRSVAVSAML
jgi:hypothetical protein